MHLTEDSGFTVWHGVFGAAMVCLLIVALCFELADEKERAQAKGYERLKAPATPDAVPA